MVNVTGGHGVCSYSNTLTDVLREAGDKNGFSSELLDRLVCVSNKVGVSTDVAESLFKNKKSVVGSGQEQKLFILLHKGLSMVSHPSLKSELEERIKLCAPRTYTESFGGLETFQGQRVYVHKKALDGEPAAYGVNHRKDLSAVTRTLSIIDLISSKGEQIAYAKSFIPETRSGVEFLQLRFEFDSDYFQDPGDDTEREICAEIEMYEALKAAKDNGLETFSMRSEGLPEEFLLGLGIVPMNEEDGELMIDGKAGATWEHVVERASQRSDVAKTSSWWGQVDAVLTKLEARVTER